MKIFKIVIIVFTISVTVYSQTEYSTLLIKIYHTPLSSRLDTNELNIYSNLFVNGYHDLLGKDSGYIFIYGSLTRISEEYKFNQSVLKVLLDISDEMRNNAEFSESMPFFIQRALISDPKIFLTAMIEMDSNKRENLIAYLTFPGEKKLKQVLLDFIVQSSNVNLNKLAKKIVVGIED